MNLPDFVEVIEVGPRDGLQNEKSLIPTADKLKLIDALNETGVTRIEATSFVSPKHVPQMQDAGEVSEAMTRKNGVQYMALIPNLKGFERAVAHGIDSINVVVGVSETFNQKNVRMSHEASMEQARLIVEAAKKHQMFTRISLATSFWCPFEGKINEDTVLNVVESVSRFNPDEIVICDTIGRADPVHVHRLFNRILSEGPQAKITAHFHETYGFGQANVMAALEAGVTAFDASVGGLGGCPFAPGAAGNLATEDLVFLLNSLGIETNVKLDKMLEAVDLVKTLTTRNLPGHIHQVLKRES
jgi:hydroxymethylglutaryl-CoA lyase